jgi:hypothetical protein
LLDLLVEEVKTLGLEELVSLGSYESSKDFLGQGVVLGLSFLCFVLLVLEGD